MSALFRPVGWAAVRAPLLPIEDYLRLPVPPNDSRARAAVAVGSGSLFDALEGTRSARSFAKELRYLIRMSTRPTPFGLFAGVGIARFAPATDMALAAARPPTRTRPDMAWLLDLVAREEARPEVRARLRYVAHDALTVHAGRVHLDEPPVSVRATPVVLRALALARTAISHVDLMGELTASTGAPTAAVAGLVEEMWRRGLLLTDLYPPLTTSSPATHVARRLVGIPEARDALETLDEARAAMTAWDARALDQQAGAAYRTLTRDLPAQTDMALPLVGSRVTEEIGREACRAAELLLRLSRFPAGPAHLTAYRGEFLRRYGPDREVPLLELLDPDRGLGPPPAASAPSLDPRRAARRHEALLDLAAQALRERRPVVELDEATLTQLASWSPQPEHAPLSLDLSVFVLAASRAELDAGRFRLLPGPNVGATAAGKTLGRFADLLGQEASAALEEVAEAEARLRPSAVWAEVVYRPRHGRSANVAVREHRRRHEIVVGTTSGSCDRVPLGELVVGVCDGRFRLRWTASDAEVVPCTGHMLNNRLAPVVCRFLEDVRQDGAAQVGAFDWGPVDAFRALPRVQVGRVVLAPARWRLDAGTPIDEWRREWDVPRYAYLSSGDNRLLLDLDEPSQVEELHAERRSLAAGGTLLLQEALPSPMDAWLPGPSGHYVTELVVPLVRCTEQTPGPPSTGPGRPLIGPGARLRPPGSDWLFAKAYGSAEFEDDLLTGPVADLCVETGVHAWFFVRYADPQRHLRLRWHAPPAVLARDLTPRLLEWAAALIDEGHLTRFCLDTYEREVERFGGPEGAAVAEALFTADTRAVVELLRLHRRGVTALDLTTLAVVSVDDLLAGIGLQVGERQAWYRLQVGAKAGAGQEYRQRNRLLRRLLGDPDNLRDEPGGDAVAQVLAVRRTVLGGLRRRLDSLADAGALTQPLDVLLRSYVHLHSNRLLGGDRTAEATVVALLARTRYGLDQPASSAARERDAAVAPTRPL